jgi:hypothetical protein
MSARVIPLEDTTAVKEQLEAIQRGIDAGRIRGLALIAIDVSGDFEPLWGASRTLGMHAGSVLRGAVAWLGAAMDLQALSTRRVIEP